jgi:hypothetical protein
MEKTKEQLGHDLEDVRCDGAFVSVGEVAWCEKEEIDVFAPPSKAEAVREETARANGEKEDRKKPEERREEGKGEEDKAEEGEGEKEEAEEEEKEAEEKEGGKKEKKYAKAEFRYDKAEKAYYCPQGKRLEEASQTTVKRQNGIELPVIIHRADGKDCQECPQKEKCTSNPKKGRVVKRYGGEEALERLQEKMKEPASKAKYKQRSRSVELGYADMKEHRGLRTFRSFGRRRARIETGLVIIASNGLKIIAALLRRNTPDLPASPSSKPPI